VANLELAWWGPNIGVAINARDNQASRKLGRRVDKVNFTIETSIGYKLYCCQDETVRCPLLLIRINPTLTHRVVTGKIKITHKMLED